MSVAVRAAARAPLAPRWLLSLRWSLRGAGLLGCISAMLLTPELVRAAANGGEALTPIGLESLLAYRLLAVLAGGALLVAAERLPGFAFAPEALLRAAGFALPIGVVGSCVGLKVALGAEHAAYKTLVCEDSLVEYATSLAYLAAGGVAVAVCRGLRRRDERLLAGLWAAFALALVVVSLEEISWGQRLFRVATPAPFESNVQGEMTVHNLPLVQRILHPAYVAVGLLGAFGWLLAAKGPAGLRRYTRSLLPPRWLLGCFLPVAIVYALFDFTPARFVDAHGLRFGFVSPYDQEPAELLLSLGFLLFALSVRLRRARA